MIPNERSLDARFRTVASRTEQLTTREGAITCLPMLSRTTHFLASIVALAGIAACSSPYADVYSFKKNSFKAPPAPKTEIVVPPPTTDPFATAPGTTPGADPAMAIPGLGEPSPAIPGLDPAAPAPAPAPADAAAPGTTPAPAPAPAPIPGL